MRQSYTVVKTQACASCFEKCQKRFNTFLKVLHFLSINILHVLCVFLWIKCGFMRSLHSGFIYVLNIMPTFSELGLYYSSWL